MRKKTESLMGKNIGKELIDATQKFTTGRIGGRVL